MRFRAVCLMVIWLSQWPLAYAQDLLNDTIRFSVFNLQLRPYAVMPEDTANIISMTTRPGDQWLYVTTQEGMIYAIDEDAGGHTTLKPWFDVASAIEASTDRRLYTRSRQAGLQAVAFHPDFNRPDMPGYGKLYTSFLEQRPDNPSDFFYLGGRSGGRDVESDSVLVEWTFDHDAGQVDPQSYRGLFRIWMPFFDHPIKQAKFNPYAQPDSEDYGLLYVSHGDSSPKPSTDDDPQGLDNALGKIIRINPLPLGDESYTIPAINPFASSEDPEVLKEIYAYGLRNAHTFSFNPADDGAIHLLAGDIGRNNIEEINHILPGGNYGWPKREGTFVHRQLPDDDADAGYITGVEELPGNDANFDYIYPVAQYDHNAELSEISSGNAIASGFVIRNGSDPNLHNQLIFANFSRRDGNIYHADFEEMLAAITQLDAMDANRDEPAELTQAMVHQLRLSLDHDNNPNTRPRGFDDFLELLGDTRSDIRFGQGAAGEMYISSKRNGTIYLVTNTVPGHIRQ